MNSALVSLYGVQIYSVFITIFATPLLIKFLGTEGYGLIGLYFVIQMLLQVVDGGLTGTITKLTAQRDLSNSTNVTGLDKSLQYFQGVLNKAVLIVLLISGIVYQTDTASSMIESSLPGSIIDMSVSLMIACIAIRFLSLPDRGLLQGLERQKTLALTNFTIVTLRYPVAVAMLVLLSADVVHFFCFQLLVVLVEVAMLKYFSLAYWKSVDISGRSKALDNGVNLDFKWLIDQSGGLWTISVLWVLVSQIDKLVLSFSVPLEAFGIFSLALVSANLMLTMFVPINQILMPRFVKLYEGPDSGAFTSMVFRAIQFYVCFFSVVASGLYIFGEELLFLWTRSSELSAGASVFLGYLAIGNFIHGITNIIFITSYASGDLAEYAKRYMIHVSLVLPISVYSAIAHQEYGVVLVWVFGAFGFFLHTTVPFLRRIFEFRTALVSIVSAFFQIMLTSGAMYLFKSQFTLVAYPNLDFLILLTGLALLLLVINYLISHVSIRYRCG
jgi:O-antigen/teichoic acid export membrane protein